MTTTLAEVGSAGRYSIRVTVATEARDHLDIDAVKSQLHELADMLDQNWVTHESARLIAHAPTLAAEVIRLRAGIEAVSEEAHAVAHVTTTFNDMRAGVLDLHRRLNALLGGGDQ